MPHVPLHGLGVEEGSKVTKGQIIARLEDKDVVAAQEQAAANLNNARAAESLMPEIRPPIVVIRDLFKSYRRGTQEVPVLQDITFEIAEGEFPALMGPSGSGKSTLLNIIADTLIFLT